MTQKEIDKFLANTKVYVNGKSKEIQEKLLSLGYKWNNGDTNVGYTGAPFLFIYTDMSFARSSDMVYFGNHKNKEISAEEILSIELTEPKYRPFKSKEECWNEMLKHQPFGWLSGGPKYRLISSVGDVYIWLNDKVYYSFEEVFKFYTFADGTPFGIKED